MAALALLAALEANQQAHADLLRSGPGSTPSAWLLLSITLPLGAVVVLLVLLVRRAGHAPRPPNTLSCTDSPQG